MVSFKLILFILNFMQTKATDDSKILLLQKLSKICTYDFDTGRLSLK